MSDRLNELTVTKAFLSDFESQKMFVLFGFNCFAESVGTEYAWVFVNKHIIDADFESKVTAMLPACWTKNHQRIRNTLSQQLSRWFGHQLIPNLNKTFSDLINWFNNIAIFVYLLSQTLECFDWSLSIQSLIFVFSKYFGEVSWI